MSLLQHCVSRLVDRRVRHGAHWSVQRRPYWGVRVRVATGADYVHDRVRDRVRKEIA